MKRATMMLAAALLSAGAAAQDLRQVYDLALEADPVFRAAEAERLAALEARPQALAGLLPSLTLTGQSDSTSQKIIASPFSSPGRRDFSDTTLTLSLNQPLFRRDRFIQLRQADAQVAQAELEYQRARQELVLRVAQAYFDVLAAIDNLSFAEAEKKAIGQQLNQTRQRFNVGLTAITDVHEAQARYDQAVAREIEARNGLAVARESLRAIIGRLPQALARLAPDMPLVRPDPEDEEAWVRRALDENLALLAAQQAAEVARQEVARASAGHWPTLDLVASHRYSDRGGIFAFEATDTAVGVQLTVPLYQGGAVTSAARQAAHAYDAALQNLEQVRRATEQGARSAFLTVLADISRVKALKQVLKSTETALEATEAGFEVGTRTAVDVLNARRELYRARSEYAAARYRYLLQTLKLKQAAGILAEDDLDRINAWLK